MTDPWLPKFTPRPDWFDNAACPGLGPDLFFPDEYDRGTSIEARKVCGRCPVRAECLAHAVESGEMHGVWGGESPKGRRAARVALPKVYKHGGTGGYDSHRRRGEEPCDECREAHNAAQRERRRTGGAA